MSKEQREWTQTLVNLVLAAVVGLLGYWGYQNDLKNTRQDVSIAANKERGLTNQKDIQFAGQTLTRIEKKLDDLDERLRPHTLDEVFQLLSEIRKHMEAEK